MHEGFFFPISLFSLATGKKKIKACNLQLAGTEEISFRCLPMLMEEFCSPTLSPPPGHIISGLSAGLGRSAERCCPRPRSGQGVQGRAEVPSNANGSVFPNKNPSPSRCSSAAMRRLCWQQGERLDHKPSLARASLEGLDEHEETSFPHLFRYRSFQC